MILQQPCYLTFYLKQNKNNPNFKQSHFDSGSCTRNHFYPHPPLKMDEKCHQKAELDFAKCNLQNLDKKYLAYGVRTK